MKKALAGAVCVALIGALATSAVSGGATPRVADATLDGGADRAAQRATGTFSGKFRNAGRRARITIKAKVRRGKAVAVRSVRYMNAVGRCETTTGPVTLAGGWNFKPRPVPVKGNRKFEVSGTEQGVPNPGSLTFRGRFSKNFEKVRGTFRTRQFFSADPPLPAEFCTLGPKPYKARR
jgi:hypothetical protein